MRGTNKHTGHKATQIVEITPGYFLVKCSCGGTRGVYKQTERSKERMYLGIDDDIEMIYFCTYKEFLELSN